MLSVFNSKHLRWEDDNTTSVDYFEFFMDSATDDLPSSQDYYIGVEKYKIAQGSLAYDISTGDMYMLKSDGTWVLQ